MENKDYIGRGTKHNQFDIIDVVLNMEQAEAHIFEYEGKKYLKFSVAARKSASQYGATHSVYVRPMPAATPETPVAQEPPAPKAKRKKA